MGEQTVGDGRFVPEEEDAECEEPEDERVRGAADENGRRGSTFCLF